jgi:hypothetical protein
MHSTGMQLNNSSIQDFSDKLKGLEKPPNRKMVLKDESTNHLLYDESELLEIKCFYDKYGCKDLQLNESSESNEVQILGTSFGELHPFGRK